MKQNLIYIFIILINITLLIACKTGKKVEQSYIWENEQIAFSEDLWDLEELYKTPAYKIIDSSEKVWSIIYDGPVFKDTLRQVFAYYSNPSILRTGKNDHKKYPGIVLAHGGGGRAFKHWVEKWAADGYAAIAFDMSARDGVAYFAKSPGPLDNHKTKFHDIKDGIDQVWPVFAIGAAIRAHSFLLGREEVMTDKTAITGISWGGYVTSITAALDHRFKVAVPVYGTGFFEDMEPPIKEFAKMAADDVTQWIKYYDPKQYIPHIRFPILFINGNKDFFFSISSLSKSYQLVDSTFANILIIPEMKHSHQDGWEPHEIKTFIDHILFDEFPNPTITGFEIQDDYLRAKYHSPVGIKNASLWYTYDLESPNELRKWYNSMGFVFQDSIIFDNPGDSLKLGFIHITDHRNLRGSSQVIIK